MQRVASLPAQNCFAFMASCCERLVPNYVAFCIAENWGDRALIDDALQQIWDHLQGSPLVPENCEELARRLRGTAPDSDDFAYILTAPAQEAVACVIYALQFSFTGNRGLALSAAKAARNTVSQYLFGANVAYIMPDRPEWLRLLSRQNPNVALQEEQRLSKEFHAWIIASPLMQAELAKQKEDLDFLTHTPSLNQHALKQLRDSSRRSGLRPLKRGLVPGEQARRLMDHG